MPPFPKEIQALMPVLRSNFWLGIHVLTIVTSYAGALAAWVIANATLGCYLFGRYRVVPARGPATRSVKAMFNPEPTATATMVRDAADRSIKATVLGQEAAPAVLLEEVVESDAGGTPSLREERRPPVACGILASLNYRVIQITVLLLAAGTILGGLWADVSWGRFWGWDPKEVGA